MPSKKPKLDTFRKVANACGGILSDIAANLGVERSTIYTWCNDDEQFAQALEDSRERFVDLAESNLRKLVAGVPAIEKDENGEKRFAGWIERPSETAIIFTLKTRGKKRGYVERQEVTGADGAELIPPRTLSPEEARQYGLKLNEEYKRTTPIRDIDIERTFCLSGMLNFTRYMFKHKTGMRFIVGDHHRKICEALDKVVRGEIKRLIINIAPRYGKTELVSKNFIAYGLALNPRSKFIHLSYSDDLVLDNSKEINETVQSDYYQRLFPEVVVESKNAKKWYTSVGGGLYAVSAAGQVTGFGAGQVNDPYRERREMGDFIPAWESDFAGAIVIDDPIKPEDALSETIRERVNNRFESTIRNRVNSRNTPIIIIMQRLHEHDLCGYLQEIEPEEWTVLSLPCIWHDENGQEQPLWEFKHTLEELHKIERSNSFVFETQYMQNPKPLEGLMYGEFKTYDIIPYAASMKRKNYTDTADTGSDYLCSICYTETPIGNFVTDILYTQKPMEYTEPATAEMLSRNKTEICYVESNNGGRSFGRNVEAQCRIIGNNFTSFNPFTQTANKRVRIFTRSNEVQNLIYFPTGWEHKWPEFASHVKSYRKQQEFNSHDDAEDALTGVIEKRGYFNNEEDLDKEDLGIW